MAEPSEDAATQVFGLTKAELSPLIACAANGPVASFKIAIQHNVVGHRGYSAEKVIPTFSYLAGSGHRSTATVFGKWFREPGAKEAHHYKHLTQHNAPVPRMYGTLIREEREIIFLEYLTPVDALHPFDRFANDGKQFPQFLTAAARFNAIEPSPQYRRHLGSGLRRDSDKWIKGVSDCLVHIWERASKGDVGEELADLCANSRHNMPNLRKLAADTAKLVRTMAVGLAHNDYFPDSVGQRQDSAEFLLLDLESVGWAPRFTDVSRWIGPSDELLPRCLPRNELAEMYLDEYVRSGGTPYPVAQFLEDVRVLWIEQSFAMLWFRLARALDGRVDWTDDTEEGRRVYRDDLHRELSALLHEVA